MEKYKHKGIGHRIIYNRERVGKKNLRFFLVDHLLNIVWEYKKTKQKKKPEKQKSNKKNTDYFLPIKILRICI